MNRHLHIDWKILEDKLKANSQKLWSLYEMDRTGGEPDVIEYDEKTYEYVFYDCSNETPIGRRSLCYDHEALNARKQNKPESSAIQMAEEMGITILNEDQYKFLQQFDHLIQKHLVG